MKARILVRIAALLILVHLLGHMVGHLTWDTPEDTKMKEVVESMKSHKADFMGATKSMADYYTGYSLMIIGLFAMSISMLWFISGFVNEQRHIASRLLYPIGIIYSLIWPYRVHLLFSFCSQHKFHGRYILYYCYNKYQEIIIAPTKSLKENLFLLKE